MNIAIRADASRHIGYGHIIRCLTLAEELKKRAVTVFFICREEEGNLIEFIIQKGFSVNSLPAGLDPEEDAEITGRLIREKTEYTDYIVLDHYGLDLTWEEKLKASVSKIMVIDDFINRSHACDILLNQNYGIVASMYDGLTPPGCSILAGSSYVLLRDQFSQTRKGLHRRSGEVRNIFIFFGGADPTNETKKALEAMSFLADLNITCTVIVGDSNPHRKEIENICASLPQAIFYGQTFDVASLMAEADLAICAGGSNTWERCCIGLPSIVMVLAENQKIFTEKLDEDGILVNLGWYENVTPLMIADNVRKLISDKKRLAAMSYSAMGIVDGEGAKRVVEEMLN